MLMHNNRSTPCADRIKSNRPGPGPGEAVVHRVYMEMPAGILQSPVHGHKVLTQETVNCKANSLTRLGIVGGRYK